MDVAVVAARDVGGESGLADPAGTEDGHESLGVEEPPHGADLGVAAEQRRH